jgi:hypothetical protein
MTVDVTGLQSFPAAYREGIPLSTQSDWGWHSFPDSGEFRLADTLENFPAGTRLVSYPTRQQSPAGQWLRSNPHRLALGWIGFEFRRADGTIATIEDIGNIAQTLDLWNGRISSKYTVDDIPVTVITAASPGTEQDGITIEVDSGLVAQQRLKIVLNFAYGSGAWGIEPEDWSHPKAHQTRLSIAGKDAQILRTIGTLQYAVRFSTGKGRAEQTAEHRIEIIPEPGETPGPGKTPWRISFAFSEPHDKQELRDAIEASPAHWTTFWARGAAVDFSGSTDPRARELERRIILSQYLTAVQCAGDMPPQETGLTFNSWFGSAHLEMHWWHGVHFALWNRFDLLERSLPWYQAILPKAQAIARRQGYAGARWPKMVGREGNEKPSAIAPFLAWQQPHPIYFAELAWRQRPRTETLERYRDIVFQTAAFMADYPIWNEQAGHFDLGPPIIPAQESYEPRTTRNPPLELAYWRWGLRTAQAWRDRLGLEPDPEWQRVLENLAPYPLHEDAYATAAGAWNTIDHPAVLGAFGMLPGELIDPERMRRTLHRVMKEQDWRRTWGWDYPLIAMTAARLGEPALAVDALLLERPRNRYLNNGHNFQEPDRLRIYLPGNGALLAAVAMMAAGWDGAPSRNAPGFPADGTWTVRSEGLQPLP